jgi:hypothetical protein
VLKKMSFVAAAAVLGALLAGTPAYADPVADAQNALNAAVNVGPIDNPGPIRPPVAGGGGTVVAGAHSARASRGATSCASPSSSIVAGTSTMRTSVASRKIAVARPMPNIFTSRSRSSTKAPNTTTMIARGRGDDPGGGGQAVGHRVRGCRRCVHVLLRMRERRNTS